MDSYIPHVVTETSISLLVDDSMRTVSDSHVNYSKIRAALKNKNFDEAKRLLDVVSAINTFGEGMVKVEDGVVTYNGKALHNSLTTRMLGMMREGWDITPLKIFLANLMENPSYRSVQQLYGFLEAGKMPITDDGHFLAYKIVTFDFKDCRTGNFDNSPGSVVQMPRNEVNEDPEQTCSHGLHVCSEGYLGHLGSGTVVIVKVNPRDVVAVPNDYNNAKMRVCQYEVLHEAKRATNSTDTVSEFNTAVMSVGANSPTANGVNEMVGVRQDADGSYTALFTMSEAAERVCGTAINPLAAFRKRIMRGTVTTEWYNGATMVRVPIDEWEANQEVEEDDTAEDDWSDGFGDDDSVWS